MSCKFIHGVILSASFTVFAVLIVGSATFCEAQDFRYSTGEYEVANFAEGEFLPGSQNFHAPHFHSPLSETRAFDLYTDYDRAQSCPNCNHELPRLNLKGWKGQPHRDKRPGGCKCGKKKGLTWYNAYHHWPNPWSVLLDHGRDGRGWGKFTDTTCPRKRDCLDVLANIRLSGPVRKDNGYFGPHCDPYGLPGKSRRGVVVSDGPHPAQPTATQPSNPPSQARNLPPANFGHPPAAQHYSAFHPQPPFPRTAQQTLPQHQNQPRVLRRHPLSTAISNQMGNDWNKSLQR